MFDSKNMFHYLFAFSLIMIASAVSSKFKNAFSSNNRDEYELIQKYLLNDSPLYGFNKPKIWIHTKYEVNARKWKHFYSRNTTDLNQPYIHLTIKSIIDHCGDDFHICLIDDETFSKLIPGWDVDITILAEPIKTQMRELAMMQLLYIYGGMIVPNSFICTKNLKPLYKQGIAGNRPFLCENINRSCNIEKQKYRILFTPNTYFMGAEKRDPVIYEFVEYLKTKNNNMHFSSERDFLGDSSQWCIDANNSGKINIIGGELIGVKTQKRKQILLEDIMSDGYVDLSKDAFGLYIPADDILFRPKYQWFAVLSGEEVLNTNTVISKYLKISAVDKYNNYNTEIRSAITI